MPIVCRRRRQRHRGCQEVRQRWTAPVIYLDWNATAPPRACSLMAWERAQRTAWANPASIHQAGQEARAALDAALASCARSLSCQADELVAVSGGSEGLATAIHGALAGGGMALAAATEHSAVLRNLPAERARLLPVDGEGYLDPALITGDDVRLVCLQAANNEVGTLQNLPALIAAARSRCPRALILVDACQAAGKETLVLSTLGADLAVIAGHKLGAPKGSGLLWVRRGVRLPPLIAGGRQQQDRRSGSEDAALPAALAAALAEAVAALPAERPRQAALVENCWTAIQARLPRAQRLAAGAPRLVNTLGLIHPGVEARHLVMRLDLAGCAVSTGAACMAARGEPSHVVRALGVPDELARSFVRLSIGWTTTATELAVFAEAYATAVTALMA